MKNSMYHENDPAIQPEDEVRLSMEERMKLAKEIRMESFPENLVNVLKKECEFELKNYPGVRYTGTELGAIKDFVLTHLDEGLSQFAINQTKEGK